MNKLIIFILITSFQMLSAQNTGNWKYLAQMPPGKIPIVFAPEIVSKKSLEHSSPAISADGKMILWSSIEVPFDKNEKRILFSKYVNKKWTNPEELKLFKKSSNAANDNPFFSADGKRFYFSSKRKQPPQEGLNSNEWIKNKNHDLWFVDFNDGSWGRLGKFVFLPPSEYLQAQFSIAANGNIYFISYLEGALNNCGIFRSEFKNGKYQQPEALPFPVEANIQNWTPFIAKDESYLLYSRCDAQGDYGNLYITFYNAGKNEWSTPQALNVLINTSAQERFPSVSPDGKYLFFTRWTKENNQDVFWVRADFINELKR